MNEVWNLDPIYKGFDDPAFEADLALGKEKMEAFSAFAAALDDSAPAETLLKGIQLEEEIEELVNKLGIKQTPTLVIQDGDSADKIVNLSNIRKFTEESVG